MGICHWTFVSAAIFRTRWLMLSAYQPISLIACENGKV